MTLDEALARTDEDEELVAVNPRVYSFGYRRYTVFNIELDGSVISERRKIGPLGLEVESFKYQDGWSLVRIRNGKYKEVIND